MTEFQINDYLLTQECESIARDIIDRNPGSDRNDLYDDIHQTVDGHQWVIYNYKALKICADCNVESGEAFLEDIGMPEDVTIYSLASIIVYGEMESRVREAIDETLDRAA